MGAWHLSFLAPIVQPPGTYRSGTYRSADQTLLLMTQGHEEQNQPASQLE